MRWLALLLVLTACAEDLEPPSSSDDDDDADAGAPPERLSDWGFFAGELAELAPAPGVLPYEVASALWADHAEKSRFVALPEGEAIGFAPGEDWTLPAGAVVIKNFWFPLDQRDLAGERRIVETRLLAFDGEAFAAHVYLWNDAQTEAERFVAGTRVMVSYVDHAGADIEQGYVVPNTNQCSRCHVSDDALHLLGLVTAQVNRTVERDGAEVSQLAWLHEHGAFASAPPDGLEALPDPFGSDAPLADRARAYLHANCAHCHRPGASAGFSGLVLLASETDPARHGVCKRPAAAGAGAGGRQYDIVPGSPDESILVYRMESTDPQVRMPELPIEIPHAEGIALVRAWIAAMEPAGCEGR